MLKRGSNLKSKTVTLRLGEDSINYLEELCEELDLTKAGVINQLLEIYGERLKYIKIILKELDDKGKSVIDYGWSSLGKIIYIDGEKPKEEILKFSKSFLISKDGPNYSIISKNWIDFDDIDIDKKPNHIISENTNVYDRDQLVDLLLKLKMTAENISQKDELYDELI